MNRIIVGKKIDKIAVLNGDELTINIDSDTNLLINEIYFKKYVININKGITNILCILKETKNVDIKINVFDGTVVLNSISYKGKDEYFKINLNKKNAKAYVYNAVIAKYSQNVMFNVLHNASDTISDVYNCGTTSEKGSIKFDVSSFVPKGCKNCLVNQDSKIITFNDDNKNEINPVLLIDEYETKAKHAAFIGNFNAQQLFYLRSRGLTLKEATALLLKGFLVGKMNVSDEEKTMLNKKITDDWR